ncbi:MAG: hypothetical protein Q8M31_23710 [Beijerinckiaceae bacterium]|nr:hypothetical protein [Beijerinckiaceae bacterium]
METQVVVISLAATVFVEAEDPAAAIALVQDKLADVEAKLGGLQVHIGLGDMNATKAFTEGEDPPGDEDD